MMSLQGDDPKAPPIKVGFPVIDIATGMSAAQAILAALLRRARGDQGRIVLDVSMVDASALLMGGMVANYWLTGVAPARVGNRGFVGSPGADTFPTADGWISTAANTFGQFGALCQVLGRADILDDRTLMPKLPPSRDSFLTGLASDALREQLVAAFARDTSAAWEEKLTAAGVPASKVHTVASYLDGPYAGTGGIAAKLDDHPLQPGKPAQILNEGFRWLGEEPVAPGAPPLHGQHTKEVLRELGYSDSDIARIAG
jgi:crotonobetainyl-CoA:carnitine CoA-transferase CaiB-like acyl-CoA transferase